MEDPDNEWEEPSPPRESGRLSWIINKGWGIGKKVVICGIIISSSPLIIPPLVIYSTIGLALSVPFGFYFISYACTEKLMSILLSTPTPSQYETDYDDGFGGDQDEEMGVGEVIGFEKQVEMGIKLEDKESGGFDQEWKQIEDDKESMEDLGGILEKWGYDEDLAVEEIEKENGGNIEQIIEPVMEHEPTYEMRGTAIIIQGDEEKNSNDEVIVDDAEAEAKDIEENDLAEKSGKPSESIDMKFEEERGHGNVISSEHKPIGDNLMDENVALMGAIDITNEGEKEEKKTESIMEHKSIDEIAIIMDGDEESEPFVVTKIVNGEKNAEKVRNTKEGDLADENRLREINVKVEGEKGEGTVDNAEKETEPLMEEIREQNSKGEVRRVVIVMQGDNEKNNNAEVGESFVVAKVVSKENKDTETKSYIERERDFAKGNIKQLQEIDMEVGQKVEGCVVNNEEKTERVEDQKKPMDEVTAMLGCKENDNDVEVVGEPFVLPNANEDKRVAEKMSNVEVGKKAEESVELSKANEKTSDVEKLSDDEERKQAEENIKLLKDLKMEEVRREGNVCIIEENAEPVLEEMNKQNPNGLDLNADNIDPLGECDLKVEEDGEEANVGYVEEKTEHVKEIKEQKPIDTIRVTKVLMQADEGFNNNFEFCEPHGVTKRVEESRDAKKAIDLIHESVNSTVDIKLNVEGEKYNVDSVKQNTDPFVEESGKGRVAEKSICIEEAEEMVRREGETSKKRKTDYDKRDIKEALVAATKKGDKRNDGSLFSSRKKKPIRKMAGTVKKNGETSNLIEEKKEQKHVVNDFSIPKLVKQIEEMEDPLKRSIEKEQVDSIVEVQIPREEAKETTGVDSEKEQNSEPDKNNILKRTDDTILNDVDEGLALRMAGEDSRISDADVKEISDETGFTLVGDKSTVDEHKSDSIMEINEGTVRPSSYTNGKSASTVERPAPDPPVRKSATFASTKAINNEDEIWEKMSALSTIVGYKVTPLETITEELKALYRFTGVEPDVASSDDPSSNLVEINDKLQFLMSIVGVK